MKKPTNTNIMLTGKQKLENQALHLHPKSNQSGNYEADLSSYS